MCTYCGCDKIELIGRFMAEHDQIVNATGDLRRAVQSDDAALVATTKATLADMLWPHTEAEEIGLFTVMARQEEFADHIAVLCGEHVSLADYLAVVEPGDIHTMMGFEEALREHINKEDNGLFPAAAVSITGEEWGEINAVTPRPHVRDADHAHDGDHVHAADHAHDRDHVHAADHPHDRDHVHSH